MTGDRTGDGVNQRFGAKKEMSEKLRPERKSIVLKKGSLWSDDQETFFQYLGKREKLLSR